MENKTLVHEFLRELERAEPGQLEQVLATYCHDNAVWQIFHPFHTLQGTGQVAGRFWRPLKQSLPDLERRIDILLAGSYDGADWVSVMGYLVGSFREPWLDIPATLGLVYLRIGENYAVRDGKIERAYILLDILDVMRQAGVYPLAKMLGSPELVPGPATHDGNMLAAYDDTLGAQTLATVLAMHRSLPQYQGVPLVPGQYSPQWHPNMMWYGPAGIGSTRGEQGFRDYHQGPFLTAFPDRGAQGTPGHYIRIGDGRFAVTSGWPSLRGTHHGAWLGVPPTGRSVELRVADWYRADRDGLLVENWVMIDILHILNQFGMDVLAERRIRR